LEVFILFFFFLLLFFFSLSCGGAAALPFLGPKVGSFERNERTGGGNPRFLECRIHAQEGIFSPPPPPPPPSTFFFLFPP
jgi:hypothetical protein